MKINALMQLLRPQQWVKNGFVFLPLFFGQHLFEWQYVVPCLVVFVAFCFAASGIYCLNDIYDVEADRKHPKKCKRPIASGNISMSMGYAIMLSCWILSATCMTIGIRLNYSNYTCVAIIAFYVAMNIAYTLKLKQIPIVDVFIIAIGFVLRVFVGGFASNIYLTHWIILMTFLLALFLAFAKRRDDVVMYEGTGMQMRKNIGRYNLAFMNQALSFVASITMVCYIMYTVSEEVVARVGNPFLYLTSVFVLAGIIKYLQLTIVDVKSGSPTKILLQNRFIQCCIVGWIITFFLILYVL